MAPFRFGVQASGAPTMDAWRRRARRAEELGYSAIYLTDHLGPQLAPLVAATVAAEATTRLHVGTLVLNNDLRHPVVVAREMAALALAAEGRVEVGVGAGWLRRDYEAAGIAYDPPAVRVARLAESVAVMKRLWADGEATLAGEHLRVDRAVCEPRPATAPRLMIGGGSRRVLSLAATEADTVGVNPDLRSGSVGGDPAVMFAAAHYDRCLEWIRAAAGDRFDALELQVTAVYAAVVGSRRAATRAASMLGLAGEEALDYPAVLIGAEDDLCEALWHRRRRWGFTNFVVPDEAMEGFAPVVARLAGR
jgi:probable F420-dependent oxidoreductase